MFPLYEGPFVRELDEDAGRTGEPHVMVARFVFHRLDVIGSDCRRRLPGDGKQIVPVLFGHTQVDRIDLNILWHRNPGASPPSVRAHQQYFRLYDRGEVQASGALLSPLPSSTNLP